MQFIHKRFISKLGESQSALTFQLFITHYLYRAYTKIESSTTGHGKKDEELNNDKKWKKNLDYFCLQCDWRVI